MWTEAGPRDYLLIGLASSVVLMLLMFQRGLGIYSVIPAVIGAIGLLLRWRLGPAMVLVAVIVLCYLDRVQQVSSARTEEGPVNLENLLLCAAMLGYLVGHYRLQGLTRHLFPVEPRTKSQADSKRPHQVWTRRSASLVTGQEVLACILLLPVLAGLTQLVWYVLVVKQKPSRELVSITEDFLDLAGLNISWLMRRRQMVTALVWHVLLLLWVFGLG